MTYRPTVKILQGPVGTGKTYRAAREAVRIIDSQVDQDEIPFAARHRFLVETGRIVWVTFHPSYSYEDFVEGFRPVQKPGGQMVYEVVDGPLKIAARACGSSHLISRIRIGDHLGGGRYEVVEMDARGLVLKSQPQRSDEIVPELFHFADLRTVEHLFNRGVLPSEISVPGTDNARKQQFTKKALMPVGALAAISHHRALYDRLVELGTAPNTNPEPVVLVIDEINRADLSRVFGELITLLESDKREGASEGRSVTLAYSKRSFSLPLTLSIIGTMNTADRSLAMMDVALRRRFEFEDIEPDTNLCPQDYGGIEVQQVLGRWNHRITALLSRDNRIGHSELMMRRLEEVRGVNKWPADDDGKRRALAMNVRRMVAPLLLEYFHDDWRKVEVIFGNRKLLETVDFPDVVELASEVVDLSEHSSFSWPSWWDPCSDSWDGDKFKGTLMET